MYDEMYRASQKYNDPLLFGIDFVVNVNTAANRLLAASEDDDGKIKFGQVWKKWEKIFEQLLKQEIAQREKEA